MKITKVRLENVAGLYVGSNLSEIEIDFSKSKNKILLIQSANGRGKSSLISSLSPFSGPTSLDERHSLSFIREGKNGYKEIHYQNADDYYILKHYYKATKDSHTVKSYFSLNGNELNENGNVSSFLALVERYFGIIPDSMRLIRLGSNVSSFISLSPAKRKEYIGKLIEEIELYLKIYKKISGDLKIIKVLMSSNSTNRYNCHISDLVVEKHNLSKLYKDTKALESQRDSILIKIEKIKSLEKDFDIMELRRRRQEALSKLTELSQLEERIQHLDPRDIDLDHLMKKRNDLVNDKISIQSNVSSYRLSVDSSLKSIERVKALVKRITADSDITSLMNAIADLKNSLTNTGDIIKEFKLPSYTSDMLFNLISKLSSFNQIGSMIYSLGNKPIDAYIALKRKNVAIDLFLKEQMKRKLSALSEKDLDKIIASLYQDSTILIPNCDEDQYSTCPFFNVSKKLHEWKKSNGAIYDDETLRYIQIISNNIDNILNELDKVSLLLPDQLMNYLREKSILDNLDNKVRLFDLTGFNEYLSLIRSRELYESDIKKLQEYEEKLLVYKNSGIDSQLAEIKRLEGDIISFKDRINNLLIELREVDDKIRIVDDTIVVVSKYLDGKKYKSTMEVMLSDTEKILKPLEDSSNEKMLLSNQLAILENNIHSIREESKKKENNINEYIKLTKEGEKLAKKYSDLSTLLDSVSTTKGIPVVYMSAYLGKIQSLANSLLSMIYEDLSLVKFQVTQDTFEIPYIKNGVLIPDVKYGSQSELALISMALSFAISTGVSKKYNILLLDEIDCGLDEKNRAAFMNMLDRQMNELRSEQVFMISHNIGSIADIPTDVIRLDDSVPLSKSQNVIYE